MIGDYFNKYSCSTVPNQEVYQELEVLSDALCDTKDELYNLIEENNKLNKQYDKLYIEYNVLKGVADKLADSLKVMSYKNILK
tara:strand:+ start:1146 stop:1394 length:249 start_codon:yes stop_codon:yes gene_type:complete